MNETIEEQLRRVLTENAVREVPDALPVPPRRVALSSPARSRRMPPWMAPAIAGVAAAVIAVVATLIAVHHTTPIASPNPSVTSGESISDPVDGLVTVPDLTGMTAAQAQSTLAGLNLTMKSVGEESIDAMKGLVVSQQPESHSTVQPGSLVTVVVGTGPIFVILRAFTVPTDLVGKSFDEAVAELKGAGLTATQQVIPGTAPAHEVMKVAGVKPGSTVAAGTAVTLQVSNNQLFVMPDLAGLTGTEAVSALRSVGWTGTASSLNLRSSATTDPSLIGRIAGHPERTYDPSISPPNVSRPPQLPVAGSTVAKSIEVRVIEYVKKQIVLPVFTPGVTTTDQLTAALSAGGASNVQIITQEPAAPPAVPHTLISMRPASGDTVDYDTVITVTVWGNAPPTG